MRSPVSDVLVDSDPWFSTVSPSLITGEQYADLQRPFARRPETELLVAVMTDALLLWVRHYRRPDAKRSREFEEVHRWFASDEVAGPFYFLNVCAVLDLDPAAVRRALAAIRDSGHSQSPAPWRTVRRGTGRRSSVTPSARVPKMASERARSVQPRRSEAQSSAEGSSAQAQRPSGAA